MDKSKEMIEILTFKEGAKNIFEGNIKNLEGYQEHCKELSKKSYKNGSPESGYIEAVVEVFKADLVIVNRNFNEVVERILTISLKQQEQIEVLQNQLDKESRTRVRLGGKNAPFLSRRKNDPKEQS